MFPKPLITFKVEHQHMDHFLEQGVINDQLLESQ